MIYPIVAYGDPVLKKPGEVVDKDQVDVQELAQRMFETMYEAHGVGLAAPQIGLSYRMFVMDGSPIDEEELANSKRVVINPVIEEETGDPWAYEEGCLSIPGIREDVFRPEKIRMRYFDENWEEQEAEFEGIEARIIQHEYDHIEGKLFVDYLSPLKKKLLKGKLKRISVGKVDVSYRMRFPK